MARENYPENRQFEPSSKFCSIYGYYNL